MFLTASIVFAAEALDPGSMASPETIRARELRRDMSGTERRVWYRLRRRNLAGYKFRRQVPIGPYFADFACMPGRLVVEIDGELHDDPERDQRKTDYLETRGWKVLRIPASATDHGLDEVIETISWQL
jgi:very-short-patch-repair endonuclease